MVEHIREYSQGQRVAEGEPRWEAFKFYNLNLKYVLRTGKLWK